MGEPPCEPPDDEAPDAPDEIAIGLPVSPAEFRELKERAKHGDEKEEDRG